MWCKKSKLLGVLMGATGQAGIRNHIYYMHILKMPFCIVPNLTQSWAIANSDPILPPLPVPHK